MDALVGVIQSVPEWHTLLDSLVDKIVRRRIELAQLSRYEQPAATASSLRKTGSTESLRPKDNIDPGLPSPPGQRSNLRQPDRASIFPPTPPNSKDIPPNDGSKPSALQQMSAKLQNPLSKRVSTQTTSPTLPKDQRFSKNLQEIPMETPRRKPGSIGSNESQAPTSRARNMIVVYYDSTVQDAFEELVKLISSSRNAMRKGKMAARMAEMRKMVEAEEDPDEMEDEYTSMSAYKTTRASRPPAFMPRPPPVSVTKPCNKRAGSPEANSNGMRSRKQSYIDVDVTATASDALEAGDDDDSDDEYEIPKLKFISTRKMGPNRDGVSSAMMSSPSTPGSAADKRPATHGQCRARNMVMLNGASMGGDAEIKATIYDELDAGLEWCQTMCEHAAHQFLRDGECGLEVDGIRKRLGDVKEAAEREIALASTRSLDLVPSVPASLEKDIKNFSRPTPESRELKEPEKKRYPSIISREKMPAVDDTMEVDDEGVEDLGAKRR